MMQSMSPGTRSDRQAPRAGRPGSPTSSGPTAQLLAGLTARETEVLAAMAEGRTNSAIAAALYVSRRSVEKHINAIFAKLLLTDDGEQHPRVQAVLIYLSGHPSRPDATPVHLERRRPTTAHPSRPPRLICGGRRGTVVAPQADTTGRPLAGRGAAVAAG